jgi:peptide-methionine (R)-S-oxide reductase
MKKIIAAVVILLFITSCQGQEKKKLTPKESSSVVKIVKTEAQWKKELTPDEYEVLRNRGTERPFTGKYEKTTAKGKYACAACGNLLFTSEAKFHSGSGWPSFDKEIKGSVNFTGDNSLGMERTELECARCGGHLGHIFDDGPTKTGNRLCINSVSLKFIPEK